MFNKLTTRSVSFFNDDVSLLNRLLPVKVFFLLAACRRTERYLNLIKTNFAKSKTIMRIDNITKGEKKNIEKSKPIIMIK